MLYGKYPTRGGGDFERKEAFKEDAEQDDERFLPAQHRRRHQPSAGHAEEDAHEQNLSAYLEY